MFIAVVHYVALGIAQASYNTRLTGPTSYWVGYRHMVEPASIQIPRWIAVWVRYFYFYPLIDPILSLSSLGSNVIPVTPSTTDSIMTNCCRLVSGALGMKKVVASPVSASITILNKASGTHTLFFPMVAEGCAGFL